MGGGHAGAMEPLASYSAISCEICSPESDRFQD
eukprot:CAMPEP_0119138264 /NCGR_PEP_ID=MMETSP1310-20130426/25328_1 /TAXON_ID=464262 /ORGANISM="Genus nov. species nov., Strain RCC2339" /LENGTH=32 /DNA_ID= /DNA_START= /DNA_END= /DNA_ORIENTATION=